MGHTVIPHQGWAPGQWLPCLRRNPSPNLCPPPPPPTLCPLGQSRQEAAPQGRLGTVSRWHCLLQACQGFPKGHSNWACPREHFGELSLFATENSLALRVYFYHAVTWKTPLSQKWMINRVNSPLSVILWWKGTLDSDQKAGVGALVLTLVMTLRKPLCPTECQLRHL